MAVRYVVEDHRQNEEINVPRKEFGFNRLRYLWEHCPTGLLYFPNSSPDRDGLRLIKDIKLKINALRFGYISIDLKDRGKALFVFDRRIRRQDNLPLKDWLVALAPLRIFRTLFMHQRPKTIIVSIRGSPFLPCAELWAGNS